MNNETDKYIIATVETALDVLEAIPDFSNGFTISDLSKKLGLSKSKAYRYIETLKKRDYIKSTNTERKHHSKYKAGFSAYETSCKLISSMDLHKEAKPIMENLVREIHETVYLVIVKNEKVLYLDKVETSQKVNTSSFIGVQLPIDSSAAGTVLLANSQQDQHDSEGYKRIKEQGYCVDKDILGLGVTSIATPVLDETGTAIACLCLVAPSYRLCHEALSGKGLTARLINAAERISCNIGYRNND
jgi:IclR family KDG regulon transcriptional repressor